jgi:hypothetical protein
MFTVVTYYANGSIADSRHYDSRLWASDAYERFEPMGGQYCELRDRFGCLARKR